MFLDRGWKTVQLRYLAECIVHVLQTLKLNSFVSLATDIVDESFDVASKLAKSTVGIFPKEIIFYFRQNELSLLFFAKWLSISFLFLIFSSHEDLLLVFDVHFVVVDPEKLM